MKKALLFLAAVIASLAMVNTASADGGLFPPDGYYIYPADQQGIIVYENNTEQLILKTNFSGSAKEFAWIIPTPSKPEVKEAPEATFDELAKYISDKSTATGQGGGGVYPMALKGAAEPESTVEVLEQKQVGIYDTAVLKTEKSADLVEWLNDNGYIFPSKYTSTVDDYVNKSWVFTAVKIRSEIAEGTKLYGAATPPLSLTFTADKIYFPLKISGIIAAQAAKDAEGYYDVFTTPITVHLYVVAPYKAKADGFETSFAGKVSSKELKDIAADKEGNPVIAPGAKKVYLTDLMDTSFTPALGRDDVLVRQASDNKSVNAKTASSAILTIVLSALIALIAAQFTLFLLLFWICFIVRAVSKGTGAQKTTMILQWVGVGLHLFSVLIALLVIWSGGFTDAATGALIGAALAGIVALCLILLQNCLYRKSG